MIKNNLKTVSAIIASSALILCFQNCTDNYGLRQNSLLNSSAGSSLPEAPGQISVPSDPSDDPAHSSDSPSPSPSPAPTASQDNPSHEPDANPPSANPPAPSPEQSADPSGPSTHNGSDDGTSGSEQASDPVIPPAPPSDGNQGHSDDIGTCQLNTNQHGSRIIGITTVSAADFSRENGGKKCNDNSSQGVFMAPHDGPNKICMSKNACESIINDYLQYTKGVLLAKPAAAVQSPSVQYSLFKANDGYCVQSHNANSYSDDDIANLIGQLRAYWGNH